MPNLVIAINYGTATFPGGTTVTRNNIEARKAADGSLVAYDPNVPADATSWTFSVPPDLYNVTCQPMNGDTPLGSPASHQYNVLADVTLSVPVSLA